MSGLAVSFVLATYRRGELLVDCLEKVAAHCHLPQDAYEIIVVDNASPDGTADLVAARLPHVRLIRLDCNRGPVAKNFAIAAARGEFVVFLDDDAYPLPGAVEAMLEHFHAAPDLAAAVFDVLLPDGTREASAYPDVFIGAGTGFRRSILQRVGGLPAEYFMQAEEYDLSFRILQAGGRIERFADMPLRHLKTPGARIAERTTRLDVRNNLYLLAKYVPAPLCFHLSADWLARYWMMAQARDARAGGSAHRAAFMLGAGEGLARWSRQRREGRRLLSADTLERIFKFEEIRTRLAAARRIHGFGGVLLADLGKNMLPYWQAARAEGVQITAIADDFLAAPGREYRGTPIVSWAQASCLSFDAIIVSNLSPVHAPRRSAELRQTARVPVIELFEPVWSSAEPVRGG